MRFFTVAEVAEMLRVRRETVYGWIKDGELATIHFARTIRIADRDLEQFVENHRRAKKK